MKIKTSLVAALICVLIFAAFGCTAHIPADEPTESPSPETTPWAEPSGPLSGSRDFYPMKKDGRWGIVNGDGQTVLPFEFGEVSVLCNDDEEAAGFLAWNDQVYNESEILWGPVQFYDTKGSLLAEFGEDDSWGTKDYDYYKNRVTMMTSGGKTGYISFTGKVIVPVQYNTVFQCGECIMAVVYEPGQPEGDYSPLIHSIDVYGLEGNCLSTGNMNGLRLSITDENYIVFGNKEGGKLGLMDADFNEIFPPRFDWIKPVTKGVFLVTEGGKERLVDKDGHDLIGIEYDGLGELYNTYLDETVFTVRNEEEAYLYFANSGQITPFKYSPELDYFCVAEPAPGEYVIFARDDKDHVLDLEGEDVIPPALWVKWIPDMKLYESSEGSYMECTYYTTEGEKLIFPECDGVYLSSGLFCIWKETEAGRLCGLCDIEGNILLPMNYAGFWYLKDMGALAYAVRDEYGVERWGVMNMDGTIIIPPEFDEITDLHRLELNDLLFVRKGNLYGLIDFSGNWVWQASETETSVDETETSADEYEECDG